MKKYKIVDKKQFCSSVITIIACLILMWWAINYIEIICKNTSPNPDYSSMNFIVKCLGGN